MSKLKKVYMKIYKFLCLVYIWFRRILFSPNHFKVNIFKRIFYAINGGYMADQIALYNLNSRNKKNYLSEFDWYKSRYINGEYSFLLNNKLVCSDLLKNYIFVPKTLFFKEKGVYKCSDHLLTNEQELLDIIKLNKIVFIKPISRGKGSDVNKIEFKNKDFYLDDKKIDEKKLLFMLKKRNDYFVSEYIKQSKELNRIYSNTSNTIRLITVREDNTCKVLFAVQRIGTKETIPVDNGSRGGLVANIDLETGILSEAKSIQKNCNYEKHPDSGELIKGYRINKWDEIKKTFEKLMEQFPYFNFVAWDILLTDNGPVVIEANTSSGVNIIQLWGGQRNDKLGEFYRKYKIIK